VESAGKAAVSPVIASTDAGRTKTAYSAAAGKKIALPAILTDARRPASLVAVWRSRIAPLSLRSGIAEGNVEIPKLEQSAAGWTRRERRRQTESEK
jgi:hypothetical protein